MRRSQHLPKCEQVERRSKDGDLIGGAPKALRHANREEVSETTIPTC